MTRRSASTSASASAPPSVSVARPVKVPKAPRKTGSKKMPKVKEEEQEGAEAGPQEQEQDMQEDEETDVWLPTAPVAAPRVNLKRIPERYVEEEGVQAHFAKQAASAKAEADKHVSDAKREKAESDKLLRRANMDLVSLQEQIQVMHVELKRVKQLDSQAPPQSGNRVTSKQASVLDQTIKNMATRLFAMHGNITDLNAKIEEHESYIEDLNTRNALLLEEQQLAHDSHLFELSHDEGFTKEQSVGMEESVDKIVDMMLSKDDLDLTSLFSKIRSLHL